MLLDIQQTLFDRTLRLPKSFFDDKETGYLMSRLLGDVGGLRWFFSSTMVYMFTSVLRFAGGIVFLLYLNWRLALAVLVVLPLMFVWRCAFSARKLRVLSHHGMERQAEVYQSVQESLAQTSLIKAFATEKRTLNSLMGKLRASLQVGMEQHTLGSVANLAIGAAPDLAHLIVLAGGAYPDHPGAVERGLAAGLPILCRLRLRPGPVPGHGQLPVAERRGLAGAGFGPVRRRARGARRRGAESRSTCAATWNSGMSLSPTTAGTRSWKTSPSRSGPASTWPSSAPAAWARPPWSACSCSSTARRKGEILIDGRPATEYELHSLRRRIGYVPQSPTLLSGTIADNLRYGDPEASDGADRKSGPRRRHP